MKNLGLLALLIVAAVTVSAMTGGGKSGSDDLSLRLQQSPDGLTLTNNGPGEASDCTVIVNSRFRREGIRLPVGQAVNVAAGSLIGGGLRFTPETDGLDRVHVLCRSPKAADGLFKPS